MKTSLTTLALAALFAFTSLTANADIYVGAGLNYSSIKTDIDLEDDSDAVMSAFLGWKPLKFVAVEAGYYDLGSFDNVDAEAYTLAALGIVPILLVDAYVKVGYANTSLDANIDAFKNDEKAAFYAIGGNVNITSMIDIYAEIQQFKLSDDADTRLFGVGARYVF